MATFQSYVICTSPRSGSTLLCNMLTATGVAGKPKSYFHQGPITDWLSYLNLDINPSLPESNLLAAIFEAAVEKGRNGTSLFGLRLQRHSFDLFVEKLAVLYPVLASDRQRIEAAFGPTLFIHLTRLDKVQQAVSYVKAQQTGLWHRAPDGTELERLSAPRDPIYDAADIRARYDEFNRYDRAWQSWFDMQDIQPLPITYEALCADPIASLKDVLVQLGVNGEAASSVVPGTAKLADGINQSWETRFRTEHLRSDPL
ncbi:sulfotransferase [Agrobacterium vitis]|uniref:Stf0 family sulfotransferase n=1 Tax=Agrobacterium vitis TaxID=373 RepID=UPI001F399812|nr:Stf0 family sulfotransferase [Agrobacterium vitis]MCF1466680.1 sulfotransferase [Agrobacterium vitis]